MWRNSTNATCSQAASSQSGGPVEATLQRLPRRRPRPHRRHLLLRWHRQTRLDRQQAAYREILQLVWLWFATSHRTATSNRRRLRVGRFRDGDIAKTGRRPQVLPNETILAKMMLLREWRTTTPHRPTRCTNWFAPRVPTALRRCGRRVTCSSRVASCAKPASSGATATASRQVDTVSSLVLPVSLLTTIVLDGNVL